MKEQENVVAYLLQVDEVVNTIRGLGEEVDDLAIVQKVLRLLAMGFDAKLFSIEEKKHLDRMKMDQLHGILTACEMRIEK